ncbi:MAG: hypothetical protein IJX23_04300 [Clostridia bacterium]|nr:hypothetical protein [Clostridia bacterium]
MIFGKKKNANKLQKTDVNNQPQQTEQPKKKGIVTRATESVNKTVQKARRVKMFFDVITTLFFIGNSLYWVFKKWGDFGNLLWVMLAVTVVYILVFVITLIKHSNNSKQMSMDNKKFKVQLKLWRTLSNLLFIGMSGLTLAQNLLAWKADGNIVTLVTMLISGFILFIKLISTLSKIFKLSRKSKKLNKKQKKLNAQQQKVDAHNRLQNSEE